MSSSLDNEGFFALIGLPKLAYHWHVLILSAIVCNFTVASSRFVSPILFPKTYNNLGASKRLSWDVHAVSLIHSLLVVALSLMLFSDKSLLQDKVFGYDVFAGNVYAIACGYFLWDTLICLYQINENGVGFFLHGACCFGVFLFAFRPFMMHFGAAFLMFEISTPFLNAHWFMDKLGMTGSTLQLINGIMLMLTFFSARNVYGLYMSYQAFISVKVVIDQVPVFLCVIYGVSNVILNILNIYWFFKMIDALKRRFSKPAEDEKKEKKGSKVQ